MHGYRALALVDGTRSFTMVDKGRLPDDGKVQTQGRKDNAAQPLDASKNREGAERYPPVRQDDAVEARPEEGRAFDPNPKPRQGAGDGGAPPAANEGRLGPGGDPAEGKP
jgi:hypothetical protein